LERDYGYIWASTFVHTWWGWIIYSMVKVIQLIQIKVNRLGTLLHCLPFTLEGVSWRWLWILFIRSHMAYLEGHMCGFCMHLLGHITIFGHILGGWTYGDTRYFLTCIFYYFIEFWNGQNPNSPLSPWIYFVGDCPLAILGFDYFVLHIHPWSWFPCDLHMWIGCMHLMDQDKYLIGGWL